MNQNKKDGTIKPRKLTVEDLKRVIGGAPAPTTEVETEEPRPWPQSPVKASIKVGTAD